MRRVRVIDSGFLRGMDEDGSSCDPLPPADLERRRREYVFGDSARLKPARIEDIRGMPLVVEEVRRITDFLREYGRLGGGNGGAARIQPGLLLHGPPGTGKTLTARVIATETGAKLIDAWGFPRRGRGWTANDIHSLFALAREYRAETGRPVIIYFDELDSVCPSQVPYRGEACVALMTELDGLGGKPDGILVIASTNDIDEIDHAVLRAGRMGHSISYFCPGTEGTRDILRYYLEKKPHGEVNLDALAEVMSQMAPAEIEELVEGAYLDACMESPEPRITGRGLVERFLREIVRSVDPDAEVWGTEGERYSACVHEAGHVIVGVKVGYPIRLVAVLRRGHRCGVVRHVGLRETATTEDVERVITVAYGGELAEETVFGERDIAGADDVGKATELSIRLALELGRDTNYLHGSLNGIPFHGHSLVSPLDEGERSSAFSEARRIRERCYRRAREIVEGFGKEGIERVARRIWEREFLVMGEIEDVVREAEAMVGRCGA
jgi:cell division protease FtsH